MAAPAPAQLLRPELLAGVSVLAVGPAAGGVAQTIATTCASLGAAAVCCELPTGGEAESLASRALTELGELDLLAIDAGGLAALAGGRGREAMGASLQLTWEVTRAVAGAAFIERGRAGRVLFVAPAVGPGGAGEELALWREGARAGLENLARTLSIEWSRHSVSTVVLAPGRAGGEHEIAALVAYLASPAGPYLSGCVIELDGLAATAA